jgi:hypothetical protein
LSINVIGEELHNSLKTFLKNSLIFNCIFLEYTFNLALHFHLCCRIFCSK